MSSVLTPTLCKAARILLGWSQAELAGKSGVSIRSLTRFENGNDSTSPKVREKLYDAFVSADIQFIAANNDTGVLDGVGLRWKPHHPHQGIKIV
ncbi:helix-turn-helix domain-containing protein [Sinorhizobium meliloti]|nr:helix-turn-helix domain-containing protein [Sinorhizobium meliloti]MDX0265789.1 helix-turn-helix domain-containing protein [Sinorhizobium meliloti]MDX0353229.1 helix-turn-helix domain-containing protein [Sinorhizobium meliloti]